MTKAVSSPGSAYEVVPNVTAAEAQDQGLAVVEYAYGTNPPTPIYGRYKDAPDGSPLGETVDDRTGTKVIGVGSVGAAPVAGGGDKGSLLNLNDPIIHSTADAEKSVHADGAAPLVNDAAKQEEILREGAVDPSKLTAKKK